MKNLNLFRQLAYISLLVFSLISCQKPSKPPIIENKFPTTPEEWVKSENIAKSILSESASIIEDAISLAKNQDGLVDPTEIAKSIGKIDGVISATSNSSETGIIIKQKDGTYSNIPIIRADDDRMFQEINKGSLNIFTKTPNNSKNSFYKPTGSGKAVIIVPFFILSR